MDDKAAFLIVDIPCEQAVDWFISQLMQIELRVFRTFDLKSARHAQIVCPCPQPVSDPCDCQMMVLLVYQPDLDPITIMVHGYNHQTWFSMVDNPQQPADPHLNATIRGMVTTSAQPIFNH